jgi:predicted ATP-dependent protease
VGQVNGLAIYDIGNYAFGKPVRITCTTSINDEGIVNVERSSKLSGHIHDKGVQILTNYLQALLAKEYALGLSASVCFEQNYSTIDGDSASIAELTAIVSAMAEIPIKQNITMTGSLNQLGEVQPIGGINEKLEGFYKCCQAVGNGSRYAAIIPAQNVSNLMLDKPTREAVAKGKLAIYPVKYFWQAFELATGVPLGAKKVSDKRFRPGSALAIIQSKLKKLHEEEVDRDHHHEHS